MITFPPKKILVAFDFSRRSLRVWRFAEAWAGRFGAELEAIHVHRWKLSPEGLFLSARLRPRERSAILKRMARILGTAKDLRVAEGDVTLEILKAAQDGGVDLIAMATEGRAGLESLACPSVTEAVARVSPVPVLSLRRAGGFPTRILTPLNLKDYSEQGFRMAEQAARAFGARLTLLHVKEGPTQPAALRRLEALAESARPSVPVELKVFEGEAVHEILAEASGQDLVVLVAHRRSPARDALLGTTAEQVLRDVSAPVLTVPVASARPRRQAAVSARRRAAARRRVSGPRRRDYVLRRVP